jgi:hypothetical protein
MIRHHPGGRRAPGTVLVPAAIENTITMDNVDRTKAKIVAEAASGLIGGGQSCPPSSDDS